MKRILAAIALLAGAVLLVAPAEADVTLCNKTKTGASVAIGYLDGASGWTRQGWWSDRRWRLPDAGRGPPRPAPTSICWSTAAGCRRASKQSGGWFCTDDNGFTTRNADYSNDQHELLCEAAGLKTEQFRQIKIGGGDVTYNLTTVN